MEDKYKIRSYKKVEIKTLKYGLAIEDFIFLVKFSAFSSVGLSFLKWIFPFIPGFTFLVLLGVILVIYYILKRSNKEGKRYFLLSRLSRFYLQYRKIVVDNPRELFSSKDRSNV